MAVNAYSQSWRRPATVAPMMRRAALLLVLSLLATAPLRAADEAPVPEPVGEAVDEEPTGDVVRYANGRLTVRAMNAPLDRLLGQIAAATGATIRGGMPNRTASFDFTDRPL